MVSTHLPESETSGVLYHNVEQDGSSLSQIHFARHSSVAANEKLHSFILHILRTTKHLFAIWKKCRSLA